MHRIEAAPSLPLNDTLDSEHYRFGYLKIGCAVYRHQISLRNRVGGRSLVERPTSRTTVRTVRYTAVPEFTLFGLSSIDAD